MQSKSLFKSKIFISAVVGILFNVLLSYMRSQGIDIFISPDIQQHMTMFVFTCIAAFRTQPTPPLHLNKDGAHTNVPKV